MILDEEGHSSAEAQIRSANPSTSLRSGVHPFPENHAYRDNAATISGQEGQLFADARTDGANLSALCDHLRELHRQRQDLHRAEKSLTLQIKAKCRRLSGGDKDEAETLYKAMTGKGDHGMAVYALAVSAPFLEARGIIEGQRKATEKQMAKEAEKLPVASWIKDIRGIGVGSLAAIVGEAGDLSNYLTVSKLWKRLGLAVINGKRQQRVAGAEALEHGYSPSRRSVIWNIGDPLVKQGEKYREIYLKRKEVEITKAEAEGLTVLPAAKIKDKETSRSQGHIHNRAKRYMEKQLIKDLWRAWRDCGHSGVE